MTTRADGNQHGKGSGQGQGQRQGQRGRGAQASSSRTAPAGTAPESSVERLTEEEQIESAKYLPRDLPPRLFEEERFLFPESYGVNRVRLLVKDPQWIFAHWDVDPRSLDTLRAAMGERAMAVSSLTLRISDPTNGGTSVILLSPGVRSWYVRADAARRSYRAELGLTLPSGEFRLLAESNTIVTPRVGPSPVPATRVMTYRQAGAITPEAAVAAGAEESRSAAVEAGPWHTPTQPVIPGRPEPPAPAAPADSRDAATPQRGGASDVHRR